MSTFLEIIKSKPNMVEKFNPYHDALGRFSTANGAASFTYAPGRSKAHDNAIAREKERAASGGGGSSGSGSKQNPSSSKEPKAMDLDEYLGTKGLSSDIDDYMTDKLRLPHGQTRRQRDKMQREARASSDKYHSERNAAIDEYKRKVESGELRPRTKIERLVITANGHDDNESVLAARRLLDKRGIDWKTGEMKKSVDVIEEDDIIYLDDTADGEFQILKADEDKRLVFGWASISIDENGEQLVDHQGDMIDPEVLETAAYDYVLNFRDSGEEHIPSLRKKGKLVESVVLTYEKQQAMGITPGTLPVGWWVGFKIHDKRTWELIKTGKYKMFSIEGRAKRVPVEKSHEIPSFLTLIEKFNPYHDASGRFSTANGATSFTYAPGKSKAHDNAIQREKDKANANAGGGANEAGSEKGFKGTLYHGSPNTDIKEFDMGRAGSNTGSGEKLIFFTDSKKMADDFSYERLDGDNRFFNEKGKKGRVYEVDVEMKNPLDLRNLSDKDIDNVVKLDPDGFLTKDDVKNLSSNHQLLKVSLDLTADNLKKLGYDGFIANTGKAGHNSLEYAVVDSKQAKIKKAIEVTTNE